MDTTIESKHPIFLFLGGTRIVRRIAYFRQRDLGTSVAASGANPEAVQRNDA